MRGCSGTRAGCGSGSRARSPTSREDLGVDIDQVQRFAEGFDPTDTERLKEAFSSGELIPPKTESQEAALARLETTLALVEGWVDVVTADATARLPKSGAIAETVRRRRATGGPGEQAFATLVGLELRPRRLREAAAMWRKVTDALGTAGRDALWSHPDLLPTAEDIDAPDALIARLTAAEPPQGRRRPRDRGDAPRRRHPSPGLTAYSGVRGDGPIRAKRSTRCGERAAPILRSGHASPRAPHRSRRAAAVADARQPAVRARSRARGAGRRCPTAPSRCSTRSPPARARRRLEAVAEEAGLDDLDGLLARLARVLVRGAAEPPPLRIAVDGPPDLADAVAAVVRAARRPAAPDVVIVVAHHLVPPADTVRRLAEDVPHVALVFGDQAAVVGPFVDPGRTPCLRCAEEHRLDDPAWRAIAAQLLRRGPARTSTSIRTRLARVRRARRGARRRCAIGGETGLEGAARARRAGRDGQPRAPALARAVLVPVPEWTCTVGPSSDRKRDGRRSPGRGAAERAHDTRSRSRARVMPT